MKELKNTSYREIENWENMIDRFNGKGNLIPHEGTVSKNRGNMWSNASTQYRPIVKGETPIVDTAYSYDILKTTKNVFAEKNFILHKSIKKMIGGEWCGVTSHILYDPENEMWDYVEFHSYEETGAGYGVKMIDDLENYQVGDIIEKGESIIRTNSYGDEMEYKWGINALAVLTIDIKSIEDAGLISKDFAERTAGWAYQVSEDIIDENNDVLKNLYGNDEIYKPFPSIGEYVQNEILLAISKNQRNHQFIKMGYGIDSASKIDKKIFAKGRVVDITVRQKLGETCQNTYLAKLIEENRAYEREVLETMEKIKEDNDNFTASFIDKYNFLNTVYNKDAGYKYKRILGNQHIVIRILTINDEVPEPGQKYTGRCGNKFTVSGVFDTGKYYSKEFGNLDYLGNGLAIFNRAIMEVPIEMYQAYISMVIQKEVMEGKRSDRELKEIILGVLNIMDKNMYKAYKEEFEINNGWEEFKKHPIIYWYQSTYHSGTNIKTCYESRNYLISKGIPVKRTSIYMTSDMGEKYLGEVFVSKLFITPLKQVANTQLSLRAKGSYDTRGLILRTGEGRIRNTPVKKSSLVGDVQANTLHPDDLRYINSVTEQESIQNVNALFAAMGIKLVNPNLKVDEYADDLDDAFLDE